MRSLSPCIPLHRRALLALAGGGLLAVATGAAAVPELEAIFADGFETGSPWRWSATSPDPCPRSCGALELCDLAHLGFDDDCDGSVDEGCGCVPGTAQSCFLGDPSYVATPGCYRGVQRCLESALWGDCLGGVHATGMCFDTDPTSCHAISGPACAPRDLADGLGNFGADALTESWTVTCPDPHASCPSPASGSIFPPVVNGEHAILYTKTTATGPDQCTYPLLAGGPGALRVELAWENGLGGTGVDLDLHLHEPGSTAPWGGAGGNAADCTWENCTASAVGTGAMPDWFAGSSPPDPVDWYLDPVLERNSCYFAPRSGPEWLAMDMGCHNPRRDVDQITCDPTTTDPGAADFCAGEAASIDFMPAATWTRFAVHYYSAHGLTYGVHPAVKIFCDGTLAAELGPAGYYVPEAALTFAAADAPDRYWLVADVASGIDAHGTRRCLVVPLYADAGNRTPFLTTADQAALSFGPPNPQPPDFGPPFCAP